MKPINHNTTNKVVFVLGYIRCRLGVWQTISAHVRKWPRRRRGHQSLTTENP
jgi:hypothetical protein